MKEALKVFVCSVFVLFALFGSIVLMTGCAATPQHAAAPPVAAKEPLEHSANPLAAIVVTSCSKSIALYVVMDAKHMILFSGSATHLYEATGSQEAPKETTADPVPWETAYALAQRAPLTSHVVMPCGDQV